MIERGAVKYLQLFFIFVFVISGIFIPSSSRAYASLDYTENSTQDSIGLSVNKSSTSTTYRQRTVPPPPVPPSSNASGVADSSVGGSVNRSGASSQTTTSEEPPCLNLEERLSALREGRDCDPSIPHAVTTIPNTRDAEPVVNQPQVVDEPVEIIITASDLLELIPSSPEILMDRGPFGLKNAHTNFYASQTGPQTVTQTMFDQEVTITATPVEYRWDYGDGDTLVSELPGYPVDVFNTETDTSHQYTDTGLYSVGLTTVFEGSYQIDGGETQMVSSTVTQQADPVEIRIWRAVTRNVDQTCQQDPQAWGC